MNAHARSRPKGGPDFGVYHHSTPADSERTRRRVSRWFTASFRELPFPRDKAIRVLDVGCGLGFLSCLCAEHYPMASVTGFDLFSHPSLLGSSLSRARENARVMGLADRVEFLRRDMFSSDFARGGFDLFVSSLVFHNLGDRRFEGYERLASWARPGSYALLADRFDDYPTDRRRLSALFRTVRVSQRGRAWHPLHRLILMKR